MSNNLLRFLNDSFLFRRKYIDTNYSKFNDSKLTKELERYRQFCLENAEVESIDPKNLNILIEGTYQLPDDAFLKQCALYINSVIIDDPVFSFTLPTPNHTQAINSYLGLESHPFNRSGLAKAATYVNHHRKAIHSNYIKFFPISYLHEPPQEIPIRYSEVLFADVLPKEILEYFRANARVSPLRKVERGLRFIENEPLTPGRGIVVRFEDNAKRYFPYMLFQSEIVSINDETREVKSIQVLPETPPDEDAFNAWVYQSINQAARRSFDEVYKEVSVASRVGINYLTRSPFIHELLCRSFNFETNLKNDVVNAVFELELPIIDGISLENMLNLRQKDGEVFENFRIELERQLRELRTITDRAELQIKMENLSHELTEVQINQINKTIAKIKSGMFADALILVGGLATTIQGNGFGVLALVYALEKGYKTYQDYINNIKENPAFFLWKLKDSQK